MSAWVQFLATHASARSVIFSHAESSSDVSMPPPAPLPLPPALSGAPPANIAMTPRSESFLQLARRSSRREVQSPMARALASPTRVLHPDKSRFTRREPAASERLTISVSLSRGHPAHWSEVRFVHSRAIDTTQLCTRLHPLRLMRSSSGINVAGSDSAESSSRGVDVVSRCTHSGRPRDAPRRNMPRAWASLFLGSRTSFHA